ncbi:MAG: DMT family transporter [Clostridia bacterium]
MQCNRKLKGILLILACALCWSTAGITIKLVPWNTFALAGWRGGAGAMILLAYMLVTKRRITICRRSLTVGAIVAVTSILFLAANKLTTAANAIVIQYTAPIFLLVFSALLLKKRFMRMDYAAVFVTVAGIALFFMDELTPGGTLGNVLALIDGAFLALMYMLTGEFDESTRLSGILIGATITFIVGAPAAFIFKTEISAGIVLCVLAMGALQVALPYILYSQALKSCPPLACSLVGCVEIILNPVWVFIFIGEIPGFWAIIGGMIIIATIIVWCILDAKRPAVVQAEERAGSTE